MTEPSFTISDLSAEFDITTRTIRFYEEKGLLEPARAGTSRVYTPADRVKLKLILRGKRLGFTLEESRNIIQMYDPAQGNVDQLEKLIAVICQKREELERQMDDLKAMLLDLDESESKCRMALSSSAKKTAQRS